MSTFTSAHPVWVQGKSEDKNLFVGFRTVFDAPDNQEARSLRITGSSCYRIWLNGHFVGHGPARAAHGFYRVDEWPLDHRTRDGANLLAVEVAGYNVNSYYLLDQPPFLQAEVVWGDLVLAWTGGAESVVALANGIKTAAQGKKNRNRRLFHDRVCSCPKWRSTGPLKGHDTDLSLVNTTCRTYVKPRFTDDSRSNVVAPHCPVAPRVVQCQRDHHARTPTSSHDVPGVVAKRLG